MLNSKIAVIYKKVTLKWWGDDAIKQSEYLDKEGKTFSPKGSNYAKRVDYKINIGVYDFKKQDWTKGKEILSEEVHVPAPDFFDATFVVKLSDATKGQLEMALASALGADRLPYFKRVITQAIANKIKGDYKSIKEFASVAADRGVPSELIVDIKKAFGRGRINI